MYNTSGSVHTWARRSPRNHPTREVQDLAVRGFLSKASLYAAHPGTAPPLVTDASRKRVLLVAGADCLFKVLTRAGFDAIFWMDWRALTPNAWAVKQDAATRRVVYFMICYFFMNETVFAIPQSTKCQMNACRYILCLCRLVDTSAVNARKRKIRSRSFLFDLQEQQPQFSSRQALGTAICNQPIFFIPK